VSDRPDYLGPSYMLGTPSEPPPTRAQVWRARARRLLWPPTPEVLAALFAATVTGLGGYGLLFAATLSSRLPSPIDWEAAAALVGRDARPGDIVALAPPWAERAREFLPERLPTRPDVPLVTNSFLDYATEELPGVRRVWLVSLPRAPGYSGDIARELASRSTAIDGPQQLGALQVTRYDLQTPMRPLYFFPDRLSSARVQVGEETCAADAAGGLRCAGTPSLRVAREVREVDFLPRACISVVASSDPARPSAIDFPDVPMGRALRGHTGAAGDGGLGAPVAVRLRVRVDGEEVGELEEHPRSPGWHAFQFDTSRFAGRRLPVSFQLSAVQPTREPICLDAMTLP